MSISVGNGSSSNVTRGKSPRVSATQTEETVAPNAKKPGQQAKELIAAADLTGDVPANLHGKVASYLARGLDPQSLLVLQSDGATPPAETTGSSESSSDGATPEASATDATSESSGGSETSESGSASEPQTASPEAESPPPQTTNTDAAALETLMEATGDQTDQTGSA